MSPHWSSKKNSLNLINKTNLIMQTCISFHPALHLASAAGQTLTVSRLITHRECDVTLRDVNGLRAMDLALKPEIREIFVRHKEDIKLQNGKPW